MHVLISYYQEHDTCILKNHLPTSRAAILDEVDIEKLKKILLIHNMDNIVQYGSIVWDFNKYKVGQVVSIQSPSPVLWYAQVVAIVAHQVQGVLIQAVLKIQWFDVEIPETDAHPARYKLMPLTDIIQPPSLVGHVLKVADFDDPDLFFIQPHFTRYYSRYCPQK
jgi:hypothetical protein